MESKVFLIQDNKIVATGIADLPVYTPTNFFPMDEFKSTPGTPLRFKMSVKIPKRTLRRILGYRSKFTYRTIRKHCKKRNQRK